MPRRCVRPGSPSQGRWTTCSVRWTWSSTARRSAWLRRTSTSTADRGLKFILQGGEKHEATGHSFVAESNYASAFDREATRVVSCNTTSIVRTLTALKRAGLLRRARGTLLRRATDPWESHESGIMNTLVPEPEIPSHQGPDAQSVDPDLDVVTMAVKVPETLAHLHYWSVQMTRAAGKQEVLDAFRTSSRIALINTDDGLVALNTVKELMADRGRPHDNLYEVALWADMLRVQDDELFYAYMIDELLEHGVHTVVVRAARTQIDGGRQKRLDQRSEGVGLREARNLVAELEIVEDVANVQVPQDIFRNAPDEVWRSSSAGLVPSHTSSVRGFLTRTVPNRCPSDKSSEYRISAPAT
jgi:hypothetical protein